MSKSCDLVLSILNLFHHIIQILFRMWQWLWPIFVLFKLSFNFKFFFRNFINLLFKICFKLFVGFEFLYNVFLIDLLFNVIILLAKREKFRVKFIILFLLRGEVFM